MERFSDALQIFEGIYKQNEDSSMFCFSVQHNRGYCLMKMGRISGAERIFHSNFENESKYLGTKHPLS